VSAAKSRIFTSVICSVATFPRFESYSGELPLRRLRDSERRFVSGGRASLQQIGGLVTIFVAIIR